MDGFGYILMPFRTYILGSDNVHSTAHTDQEASEQRDQYGSGAYRARSLRAREPSDHSNVGHIEQDLQNIGKHEWDAETNNGWKQRSLRQGIRLGFTHTKKSSFDIPTPWSENPHGYDLFSFT